MQEQPLTADMLQRAVDWIMANPDSDSAVTLKRLLRALYEVTEPFQFDWLATLDQNALLIALALIGMRFLNRKVSDRKWLDALRKTGALGPDAAAVPKEMAGS